MRTLGILFLLIAATASAQTTTRRLQWDQTDAGTVAAAQALTYTLVVDGKSPVVVSQTCTQPNPATITCTTPIAQLGKGLHTLVLTVDNGFDNATATLTGTSPALPANLKLSITITVP